jgi:uncharacterized caspase-like protein
MKSITVYALLILMVNPFATTAQVNTVKIGNTWVLAIGISEYNNSDIKDLEYADDDAYFFLNHVIQNSKSKIDFAEVLLNQDASSENVISNLNEIALNAKPNDIVVAFVSGHGLDRYILLNGGVKLAYAEINKIFRKSKCKNVYIILDVCHAGSSLNLINQNSSVVYLCSCEENQSSIELNTLQHGLFSFYVLEGLTGAADTNKDNIITDNELFKFAFKGVNEKNLELNVKQNPVITLKKTNEKPMIYLKK